MFFFSSPSQLIYMVLSVPGVIIAFTMKGFGQALVSKWLGDPTPEENGRLTVNPLAHIDWIGLLFMVLFRFGWTKPMPTNYRYYKKYKRDTVLYSLSGSIMLTVTSFVMSFFYVLFLFIMLKTGLSGFEYAAVAFYYASLYPVVLGFFYLFPLPGLDGYKILTTFTPYKWNRFFYKVERYSMFIFMGFILFMSLTPVGSVLFYPATRLNELFHEFWSLLF